MSGLFKQKEGCDTLGYQAIDELRSVSGTKAKEDVLRKYKDDPDFCLFLYYALNPSLTYNLSEKTLRLKKDEQYDASSPLVFFENPFECFEYCSRLRGLDDATIRQVKSLLYGHTRDPKAREIVSRILAKTLRLGVTAKTVNKIIPGLIPVWEVQQSYPIDRYPISDGTEFWLTQKLNGNRATYFRGKLIARSGTPYTGLGHIISAVRDFCDYNEIVLDGELILKDSAKGTMSDNEAFRVATGILNSASGNKTDICFVIFDMLPLYDFESEPAVPYSFRRRALDNSADYLNTEHTRVLPVLYHGTDQRMIDILLGKMIEEDKEGLMLNTDVPYYRTRHRGILKIKRFYTMDLPIVGTEEGTGRLAGTLGALILDYQGNEVKVGSGFTDAQRSSLWEARDELPGRICEVKYKEISSDKNTGLDSLQFPVFIRMRDDKTEPSYG